MATDYAPTPVEDFLDPDDPAMFPRLTPEQVEYLAGIGAQQTFGRGDQVFGHGQRETPLYIVQSGAVDIIDHAPEGDRYFTQCQERTFIGDLSMFTGEPTLAAGYAAGPTSLIALPPEGVRRVVATAPADLGDLLLRIMVARRDWLMGRGLGQQKLSARAGRARRSRSGSCWSATSFPSPGTTWRPTRKEGPCSTASASARRSARCSSAPTTSSGGRPSPRSPTSWESGHRSTLRPSMSSCSAAARPGWPRRSTPRRRVSARWWSNVSLRVDRPAPALASRTTSVSPPVSRAPISPGARRSRRGSSAPSFPARTRPLGCGART